MFVVESLCLLLVLSLSFCTRRMFDSACGCLVQTCFGSRKPVMPVPEIRVVRHFQSCHDRSLYFSFSNTGPRGAGSEMDPAYRIDSKSVA